MLAPRMAEPAQLPIKGNEGLAEGVQFEDILLPQDADLKSYVTVSKLRLAWIVVLTAVDVSYAIEIMQM